MLVRTASAAAILAMLGLSPAFAQSVTPALVLAGKSNHASARGFADRTARLTSIMGPEVSRAAPLTVPTRPTWTRAIRRDADAGSAMR